MNEILIITLLILSVTVWLIFDLMDIWVATGYKPSNKESLKVYAPYTFARTIIMGATFLILVYGPSFFGVINVLAESVVWPIAAMILSALAYLPLVRILGNKTIGENNLTDRLEKPMTAIKRKIRLVGRNALLDGKVADPEFSLALTRSCFCRNAVSLNLSSQLDIIGWTDGLDEDKERYLDRMYKGQQNPSLTPNDHKSIIVSNLSWILKNATNGNPDIDSIYNNVLRAC